MKLTDFLPNTIATDYKIEIKEIYSYVIFILNYPIMVFDKFRVELNISSHHRECVQPVWSESKWDTFVYSNLMNLICEKKAKPPPPPSKYKKEYFYCDIFIGVKARFLESRGGRELCYDPDTESQLKSKQD